jgi:predicted anti-sigma-YlaC factor YlaD
MKHFPRLILAATLVLAVSGCSVRRMAVNRLSDALASSGSGMASDEDPELVKAAVPFGLKLTESLLAENPRHVGLLTAAASGFTQYAYAFVQPDADELEEKDVAAATAGRLRAKKLYLRARNYGLRGLEVEHPGFQKTLAANPKAAVRGTEKKDVPLLYWTAASWAAAISVSKNDPDLIGDLPKVEAMMDRALELDESYNGGAIHSFLITYELSRADGKGDPVARSRRHFERALELGGGHLAGPLVAFAETVEVKQQNVTGFQSLLKRALAVNVDAKPEWRLENLVMQRHARWLLAHTDDLFLTPEN